jgi:hypothetical protein
MVETVSEKIVVTDSSRDVDLDKIVLSSNLFKGTRDRVKLGETCRYCNKHKPGVCLINPCDPVATEDDYYCKEPKKYE